MTFVHPEALLLFLPALATAAWIVFWRGPASFRLPGHWHRVIEAPMQPFMARQVASRSRMPWAFWLAVWSLMVLGLARPILESGAPAPYGNLAGRVIAIDLGADTDLEQQKLLVYRILDAAPTTPTALVLATAEAFDVVPFTTDRGHIDRYLKVAGPAVMPVPGRAPGIAVIQGESVLKRAGLAVGQLVLLTGGHPPTIDTTAGGDWLRAVVVDHASRDAWEGYADGIGATLADETTLDDVVGELDDAVADAVRDSDRSGDLALGPWLVAAAGLLWLLFFRRIRSA